jgi:hypothetical protein
LLKLRCQLLGTHSEHPGKWPYSTGGNPKEWQAPVPVEGARTALFSIRKINNAACTAMCYRNGKKGIGMPHTTLSCAGVWDLLRPGSPIMSPPISHKTITVDSLYLRWLSSVFMFVACPGCTPWFEARVGHLTGTTALKIIKTVKFVLLDDPNSQSHHSVRTLLEMLGLKLERRSREQIASNAMASLKKCHPERGALASGE